MGPPGGAPIYPHVAGPSNGWGGHPYYQNNPQYIPQPPANYDVSTGPYSAQPASRPSMSRPSRQPRTTTAPVPSTPFPLKPALKKPTATSNTPWQDSAQTQIHRDTSGARKLDIQVAQVIPATDPDFRPRHMFVSFRGNNEIRLENIMKPAMDELRRVLLTMWEGGIESDRQHAYSWTVKFRGAPWDLRNPDISITWKMIVKLFTLFAQRGFSFETSINTGTSQPRLIFEGTEADDTSQFFLAYLSRGGSCFTIIDPPPSIDVSFGALLNRVLPHKIARNEVVGTTTRVVELKRRGGFGEVEPAFFLMHILKILVEAGFSLNAAVPLRTTRFGFQRPKEVLVFKGVATDL
ncbi:hypothetical protein BD779DRAFT_35450 [Infundibulicybe gibba]|nr:hypothetical protein BD779DRAFT_35450 [Infundibulicybe gibba]